MTMASTEMMGIKKRYFGDQNSDKDLRFKLTGLSSPLSHPNAQLLDVEPLSFNALSFSRLPAFRASFRGVSASVFTPSFLALQKCKDFHTFPTPPRSPPHFLPLIDQGLGFCASHSFYLLGGHLDGYGLGIRSSAHSPSS